MKAHITRWYAYSVASFFISAMTIWFMPLAYAGNGVRQPLVYVLAAVFWLGIIVGLVLLSRITKCRRRDRAYRAANRRIERIALLRFFSNIPAMVFDVLLIAGFILSVLSLIFGSFPQWLSLAGIFMLVFSLEMHGAFNGRNYAYVRYIFNKKMERDIHDTAGSR